MRSIWNNLGDPALHLLVIALILVYLALGRTPWSNALRAEDPLPVCNVCHSHYLPGNICECPAVHDFAHASP
jgi:hypothetical protein